MRYGEVYSLLYEEMGKQTIYAYDVKGDGHLETVSSPIDAQKFRHGNNLQISNLREFPNVHKVLAAKWEAENRPCKGVQDKVFEKCLQKIRLGYAKLLSWKDVYGVQCYMLILDYNGN